ncbi:hypothetical protein HELRODRAFT_71407 [Helobdella robusta]|uniref:Radial spoke head protein 9 homolog n=1 Tax=Helobdella robusta TaxID=6412 RepID=T1G0K9_HELRO|nr:hypothetical protein HELRODRAFT_71407 [Helobdella robusta]ESO11539.1 hypothetical protein HELRODRAFT_71407 [Helobdella robusta]
MNSEFLNLFTENLSHDGIVMSVENKSAMETSLRVIKNEMKFDELFYWGRISTLSLPYYIVQGVENGNKAMDRRTLYSQDCVNWALLNPPSEKLKKDIRKTRNFLTGEISATGEEEEEEEEAEEYEYDSGQAELPVKLKEIDRLTGLIDWIDTDTKVVPRGAYTNTVNGFVTENPLFIGLTSAEASKLYNYRHFRPAIRLLEKTILYRADLDRSIDFLDPISEDPPSNISWCLQYERGGGLVSVKSLLWPGYIFYHIPNTRFFGSVYYGNGMKNMDLPFMI